MDLSSLPEAQKQQLQQLQQQFKEHQAQQQAEKESQYLQQQQQQYQDYASQAYDPSQVQSYDPSYYSYYQQYQQDPQHSQQEQDTQQQNYSYYQTNYANAYSQHPQQQTQRESASILPPGVLVQQETAPLASELGRSTALPGVGSTMGLGQEQVQVQHQQNANYPQQVGAGGDQLNSVPTGLNPAVAAAVAALSQLTHFAGTMDAAEKAMVGLQGRQWFGRSNGYGPLIGGPGSMYPGQEQMLPPD
ncbi:unnamed protein product [Ilex paraguariensis]|uniref:Uncharacterized protein n=1 Tax=Ilex paraguariensis TaxID=185542 RepID=A0ABC8ULL2_9AQUA